MELLEVTAKIQTATMEGFNWLQRTAKIGALETGTVCGRLLIS